MCGLVGIAGKLLTAQHIKTFRDMLYFDTIRGEDSTGVALISKAHEAEPIVEVLKSVGSAAEFYYDHTPSKKVYNLTTDPVSIMLGHNRYATQGVVNLENAHPFDFPNVVGAHNGTVQMSSLSKFNGYLEYDVDSRIIYSHMSHLGVGAIDQIWAQADGALALTWWDKQDRTLKMIRNKERTLFVAYTEDDSAVLWASEAWMFWIAASRNGLKLKEHIEVVPNRLYTFTMMANGKVQHVERDLPPFVPKPVSVNYGYGRNGHWSMYDDGYWGTETKNTVRPEGKRPAPANTSSYQLMVTEFHDNRTAPAAIGVLSDGQAVYVNVPVAKYQNVKDALQSRDITKGYYFCRKLYRYAMPNKDFDYWCNWNDLQWIKFKGKGHILRTSEGGFQIRWDREGMAESYAPWFHAQQFLTKAGYESKTRCGCVSCNAVPTWEERTEIRWVSNDAFFCATCQESALVQDIIAEVKGA